MSYAKRKLVISRPPMLTLPSWSSNASHMILSRKVLKRVGESRLPCRTPNYSPVLPLNRTALLSYRFSMVRMMLALMLYFLIVAHKASCRPCQVPFWSLWRHDRCWCCRYFSQRILRLNIICSVVLLPALKSACSSAVISSACGWSLFRMKPKNIPVFPLTRPTLFFFFCCCFVLFCLFLLLFCCCCCCFLLLLLLLLLLFFVVVVVVLCRPCNFYCLPGKNKKFFIPTDPKMFQKIGQKALKKSQNC